MFKLLVLMNEMKLIGPVLIWFIRLQYGSEEFPQDSPRYTSPKPGGGALYSDSYFMGKSFLASHLPADWGLGHVFVSSFVSVCWRRLTGGRRWTAPRFDPMGHRCVGNAAIADIWQRCLCGYCRVLITGADASGSLHSCNHASIYRDIWLAYRK